MLDNIAIIAGSGKLPYIIAKFFKKKKKKFIILSIKNFSNVKQKKKYNFYSLNLGQGKKAINILKENNIKNLIFLGGLKKPTLFELKPDLWTLSKIFSHIFFKKTDDKLLRKVISIFESEGFNIIGLSDITDDFFLKEGIYGKRKNISADDNKIISKIVTKTAKWTLKDIGQAAIASKEEIIKFEDDRGTDYLIKKVIKKNKFSKNSYIFVKLKKINQDNRVDLPTFGIKTLNYIAKTNIKYIVLQANSTVILDKKKIIKNLKKYKKTLISAKINYFPHNENCHIQYD